MKKRNEKLLIEDCDLETQFIECFEDGSYSQLLLKRKYSNNSIGCWTIKFKPYEEIKPLLLSEKEKELKKEEQRIRLIVSLWKKIHPEYFPLEKNKLIKMGFAYNVIENAWKYEWEKIPEEK